MKFSFSVKFFLKHPWKPDKIIRMDKISQLITLRIDKNIRSTTRLDLLVSRLNAVTAETWFPLLWGTLLEPGSHDTN